LFGIRMRLSNTCDNCLIKLPLTDIVVIEGLTEAFEDIYSVLS
jgi:hypothetical protein